MRGVRCCQDVARSVGAARHSTEEMRKAACAGPFHAPKRTRTSTRLSRTRPSTWRVYQFRHRRGCRRSIALGSVPVCVRPDPPLLYRTDVRFTATKRGAEPVMDIGKDLTKRQQEIFDFIKKYSAKYGYPPTVRDIGKAVGLASSSTVHAHLANLEKI